MHRPPGVPLHMFLLNCMHRFSTLFRFLLLFLLLVVGAANRRQSLAKLPESFSLFTTPQPPAPSASWETPVRHVTTQAPRAASSYSAL